MRTPYYRPAYPTFFTGGYSGFMDCTYLHTVLMLNPVYRLVSLYKVRLLYDLDLMTPIRYTLALTNRNDNTQTRPLVKRLGARLFRVNTILADKAYDIRENIENHVNVLFTAARNKWNTK